MQDNDNYQDLAHELWLIYCQLKDAEIDAATSEKLVASARYRLGQAVNAFNKLGALPKSPGNQADKLNCRCRQKGLTLDTNRSLPRHDSAHCRSTHLVD